MKIAHISDLHFATPRVEEALARFRKGVEGQLGRLVPDAALQIHFGDRRVLEKLRERLQIVDPDVIVVSGDITTFGDEDSFEHFGQWCAPLVARPEGRVDRRIVVVPGNHDALKDQFSQLRHIAERKSSWLVWAIWKVRFSGILEPISDLLTRLPNGADEIDPLQEFHSFVERNPWVSRGQLREPLGGTGTAGVRIVPFSTVSEDPLWMNRGQQRLADWSRLQAQLREDAGKGTVTIVVAHHNPVTPPNSNESNVEESYNSMSGTGRFLKGLQDLGADLLIHGHHHEYSLLKFDFDHKAAGHAFALGAESSSDPKGGGFNLLTIGDPNHVVLTRYRYRAEAGFEAIQPETLHLERHRPSAAKTLSARYELKEYVYPSDDSADQALAPLKAGADGIVYMSGRSFKRVRNNKFADLLAVLKRGGRVRVLLVDPDLLQRLRAADPERSARHGDLWGRNETLQDWQIEATETLVQLKDLVLSLGDDAKKRIDVRLSHTLPPFGSYARDPDTAWGKMSVKLLPIGGVGDLDSAVLRLNRRANEALYDYYITHLKYLFLKGRRVLGEWTDDGDLRKDIGPDLLGASPTA